MKKVMTTAVLACTLSLLFSVFCLPVLGAPSYVVDEADLLTEAELSRIEAADCAYPVYLFLPDTAYYDDYEDVERYTERMMQRQGISESSDVVILAVYYTDEWHYDLYTYGQANDEISNREVNRILDADGVYGNLKAGRIADGFLAFTAEVTAACGPKRGAALVEGILICLAVGAVCAGAAVLIVVLRYRMKIRKTNYPLDRYASLRLQQSNDVFTGTTVTRRKVSSSSGKSGGGGGSRGGR